MTDDLLTLAELAERSGVEIRTLRSWMAQGVVPGAENVGRNARYAPEALLRALAARAMREIYGMSLAEIRQDLLTADAARLQSYAAMASPPSEAPGPVTQAPPPDGTSAADYLRRLRKTGAFGAGGGEPSAGAARSGFFRFSPPGRLALARGRRVPARQARRGSGAARRIAPLPSEVARRRPRPHPHHARP